MNIKINQDNINEYYDKVNALIDTYETWRVKPSSLKSYLKPGSNGLKNFIEKNNLENIDGIEKVIKDVVDDRCGVEQDTVMTFESFTSKEQTISDKIFKGIESTGMSYEKVLSDLFKVSLSHIMEDDKSKHIYKIEKLDSDVAHAMILSNKDIDTIKKNYYDALYTSLNNRKVNLDGFKEFNLTGLIDKEYFIKKFSENNDVNWSDTILTFVDFKFEKVVDKGEYKIFY